jgi:hypothetical protein
MRPDPSLGFQYQVYEGYRGFQYQGYAKATERGGSDLRDPAYFARLNLDDVGKPLDLWDNK